MNVVRQILAGLAVTVAAFSQSADLREMQAAVSPLAVIEERRPLPARLSSTDPPPYTLAPLGEGERAPRRRGPLVQSGVRRSVGQEALGHPLISSTPEGRVLWSVALRSPGASHLRIHFQDFDLGPNDEVWLFTPGGGNAVGPYQGKGPLGDGDFWSAGVASETVVVAFLTHATASGEYSPPFSIDAVAHRWAPVLQQSPSGAGGPVAPDQPSPAAAPAACNLDVTCYPGYQTVSKAVVQYDFVADSGGLYACSGAMINTRNSSLKPYLLTANHCIGTNPEARTIEARFFYQTSTCNGTPPAIAGVPTVLGGSFLAGAPISQGDFSLVLLASAAPAGTIFAGWSGTFDAGASAAGIHHPESSYKRIALGTRGPDVPVNVEGDLAPANLYYQMNWSGGLTQPGSSGSPLVNGNSQIVGTLTGGPIIPQGKTACEVPASGVYGRFSNAYAAISSYLEDTPAAAPGPAIFPNGMVNAASFQQVIAPGMILSIFGTNLAAGTASASQVPLPASMAGVSVSINNKPAPLYFVSPGQLNVQVPFEILPGIASVTVAANGGSTSRSMNVSSVAPGTFVSGGRIVPFPSGRRGDASILYITGQGPIIPAVATGAAPAAATPVNQLPRPFLPVSVTIGGNPAQIFFAGVPSGLVGVTQINFFIPGNAPLGDQPIVVIVGGQASQPAFITVTN